MNELKNQIFTLLKNYRAEKQKAALLRHEMQHPVHITPEEVLESMAFSKGDHGTRPLAGHISDKTYHIAVNYCQEANRLARSINTEIAGQLLHLERKLERLEYCVSQLPDEQAAVIRMLYFEGRAQKELPEELHLSESSIKRCRNKALSELASMYQAIQQAGVVLNW